MMSVFKKVKLGVLASVVILSPQGAYTMISDLKEERGYIPQTNPRETLVEDEETRGVVSSSRAVDQGIQEVTFIPKDALDNISAKLSTNGATLKVLESKSLEIPKISPQSPRKKGKPNGEMESFLISRPSTTMEIKTPQRFEESLPTLLLKFSERYIALRQEIPKEELRTFNQLYKSFIDVVQLYKNYYPDFNPYSGIVPKDPQEDPKRYQSFMALAKIYQSYYPEFEFLSLDMQRAHYRRARSLTLGRHNSTNIEKELKSIDQGESLSASIYKSPLFRRMHASSEEGSPSSSPSRFPSVPPQPSEQRISPPQSPPVSSRLINGVSLPSLPLLLHSPRPSQSSRALPHQSPVSHRLRSDLSPSPTPPRTLRPSEESVPAPQSPPVPHRLRSDLRPLPPLPRNVVSSSSRLLPQLPQSSGESVPPPPVAPRHRSLSLSPKATFSGLSPAGFHLLVKDDER